MRDAELIGFLRERLAQALQERDEALAALREYYESREAVVGLLDFELHDTAIERLKAADASARALLEKQP